jgi:hypothetical protein
LHHRVIAVVTQLSQSAVAQEQVYDQNHDDGGVSEDRAHLQVLKASSQLVLQVESRKQRLKDDETCERGELLVFKSDLRQRVNFPVNGGFGK